MVGDVPVVISLLAIHEIASSWASFVTSVNEWGSPASGWFSMLWIHTAVSPRDTGVSGAKQAPLIPVIALSTDHCTASVYQLASGTSPYPATAPPSAADPINNAAVNEKTSPTVNQTRLIPQPQNKKISTT